MNKRILVLSTVATHPQNAGHRSRIFNLMQTLKDWGQEVCFVYLHGEYQQTRDVDMDAMSSYWGEERFFHLEYSELKNAFSSHSIDQIKAADVWPLDDWFDDSIAGELVKLDKRFKPDIVIAEYVILSKAFEYFNVSSIKVIDTNDIFTERNKLLKQHNINYDTPLPSFTLEDEKRALDRADIIISIQTKETEFFNSVTNRKVVQIGHLAKQSCPRKAIPIIPRILYVGSGGDINQHAISYFIEEILPIVKAQIKNVELIVVGDISKKVNCSEDNITKISYAEDLSEIYNMSSVCINTDTFATGLSIKSITALSYSMPLITTKIGMRGIEHGSNKAFLSADNNIEFAEHLINVLNNSSLQEELANSAYEFYKEYQYQNHQGLEKILL